MKSLSEDCWFLTVIESRYLRMLQILVTRDHKISYTLSFILENRMKMASCIMKIANLREMFVTTTVSHYCTYRLHSYRYILSDNLPEREAPCDVCETFLGGSLSATPACCPVARFRSVLPPTVTTGSFGKDVTAGKQYFCKQWLSTY
jgi:hypothetical protein